MKPLRIGFPTPTFVPESSRPSPLPSLNWADGREVWDLMLHKDDVYCRNPLMLHRHPTLQAKMRSILMDWLSEVCDVYRLHRESFHLALDFIDRYLSRETEVPKHHLQLLGITCLFVAAKIEEIYPPKLAEFAYVTDGACTESDIMTKELVVLKTLKWQLCPMTPNHWLTAYIQLFATLDKKTNVNVKKESDGNTFLVPEYSSYFFAQVAHLIDLSLLDIDSLRFPYNIISASALYHFTNEDIVNKCAGLTLKEIKDCVIWLTPFALAIKDDGFDDSKFKSDESSDIQPNLQSHTADLQLLEKAHKKKYEIELNDSKYLQTVNSSSSPSATISLDTSDIATPPKRKRRRITKAY